MGWVGTIDVILASVLGGGSGAEINIEVFFKVLNYSCIPNHGYV